VNALDSVLDAVLLATIVLQFRGRRLTPRNLALPVVIVVTFLLTDLRGVPTAGNVGYLVPEGVLLGLVFGVGAGDFTRVSARGGGTDAQAGLLAAAFWTVGVVGRAAFSSYATDGESGADRTIGHLMHAADITTSRAIVARLLLMVLVEVGSRQRVAAARYLAHRSRSVTAISLQGAS
jgi:hypothetical protein